MEFCQHLFAQLMLTAIHIIHFKFLLYFPNLHHPVIVLLFLVHLEQERDISLEITMVVPVLFYDLHENMVFVVMRSFDFKEFPLWCPSNSNL